jgi:hypothetical protein
MSRRESQDLIEVRRATRTRYKAVVWRMTQNPTELAGGRFALGDTAPGSWFLSWDPKDPAPRIEVEGRMVVVLRTPCTSGYTVVVVLQMKSLAGMSLAKYRI